MVLILGADDSRRSCRTVVSRCARVRLGPVAATTSPSCSSSAAWPTPRRGRAGPPRRRPPGRRPGPGRAAGAMLVQARAGAPLLDLLRPDRRAAAGGAARAARRRRDASPRSSRARTADALADDGAAAAARSSADRPTAKVRPAERPRRPPAPARCARVWRDVARDLAVAARGGSELRPSHELLEDSAAAGGASIRRGRRVPRRLDGQPRARRVRQPGAGGRRVAARVAASGGRLTVRGMTERLESRAPRATVRGHVQGVGFRWFVAPRGAALGLSGWVRERAGRHGACRGRGRRAGARRAARGPPRTVPPGARERVDVIRGPAAATCRLHHPLWRSSRRLSPARRARRYRGDMALTTDEKAAALAGVPLFAGISASRWSASPRWPASRIRAPASSSSARARSARACTSSSTARSRRPARRRRAGPPRAGEFFGELSVIDQQPRNASVQAAEPTTCLALASWDLLASSRATRSCRCNLIEGLVARVRSAGEQHRH